MVRDVFQLEHMTQLKGNMGIGHVRYPTAGSSSNEEAQPFSTTYPFGIGVAHNGNLTNTEELGVSLQCQDFRHVNTDSDSEGMYFYVVVPKGSLFIAAAPVVLVGLLSMLMLLLWHALVPLT